MLVPVAAPHRRIDKFRALAREPETDDDDAAFDERLKKLANARKPKTRAAKDEH
jgi:hypothetical protein